MSPFASAAPELSSLGYSILPVIPYSWSQHSGRGLSPGEYRSGAWQGMSKWQQFRDTSPSSFQMGLWTKWPDANIGIVLGASAGRDLHVVGLDFDAIDPEALDALLRAAPSSPMVKRGSKGETRFFRAAKSVKSKGYDGPDGRLLDVLTGFDTKQTICPPSISPRTGKPYVWLQGPVAAVDLPVLTQEDIEALEEALEQCGWERGGKASNKKPRAPSTGSSNHDEHDDFSVAKRTALANLDKWVPALDLHGLRPARGGYECVAQWRASSSGQALHDRKRNLSIQSSGIKDFGTNWTGSAIDLVMVSMGMEEGDALRWLQDRLGLGDDGSVVIDLRPQNATTDEDLPEPLRVKPGIVSHEDRPPLTPRNTTATPVVLTGGVSPDPLLSCPGLVGQITDWICDTALQPQRLAALLAALQVVGTAAGRTFSGPTRTGTHLYGLFLAPSGASKDHPLKCIDRLLRASTMGAHVGPGEYMSMSALVSRLNRQPLTISAIDEFGDYLARINGRKASPHEKAITRTLRTAWGSSFDTMSTPEWAGRVGEPIFSPALSIFGVSTHESFFKGLDGDDVFNGFLNRFVIFSTQDRVEEVEPALDKSVVPEAISDALVAIYTAMPPLSRATSHNAQSDGPLIVVPWQGGVNSTAHKSYLAYRQTCMRREESIAIFYTRSAEIAQRLATIRAIGRDGAKAVITLEDIDWGIALADMSARDTVEMARDYMSENQTQADAMRILRTIKKRGNICHRDLVRSVQNRIKSRDLADILKSLEESGEIVRSEGDRPPAGGRRAVFYSMG